MTPTRSSSGSTLRLALLVLTSSVAIGGASYGIIQGRVDDKCAVIITDIAAVRGTVERDALRIDECEDVNTEMRERLARIETKLDALLERAR